MTASKSDSTFGIWYFPRDDRVLFTRDKGDNELNHLYVREVNGEETDLTPGEKLRARFVSWTAAGDAFYTQTNDRDARSFDV